MKYCNVTPKIILINPPSDCVDDDRVEPPLGLLYIAAVLHEKGFEDLVVLDMTGGKSSQRHSDSGSQIPIADVYGINCFSTNYQFAKKIITTIKGRSPNSYVVLGGPHPTAMPNETLSDSNADAVVVGEGEDSFCSLVEKFSAGVRYKGVIHGEGRDDIDSYPIPARECVNYQTYSRKLLDQPVVSLISSRGCAHHCIFCNSIIMGGGSQKVRYRSPDNVLSEIRFLREKFAYFRFNDDHFTGNPRLEELLVKMVPLKIRFRIFARVQDLTESVCQLLKQAGCVHVTVGLESLNPDNLKIIGKKSQIGQDKNIACAKTAGLTIRASFMVGLPFDTDGNIEKHFLDATKLDLDEFAVYPLIPYPGTVVWKHPEKLGYKIIHDDFTDYIQMGSDQKTCYALAHKNFSSDDAKRWKNLATQILSEHGVQHMKQSQVAK